MYTQYLFLGGWSFPFFFLLERVITAGLNSYCTLFISLFSQREEFAYLIDQYAWCSFCTSARLLPTATVSHSSKWQLSQPHTHIHTNALAPTRFPAWTLIHRDSMGRSGFQTMVLHRARLLNVLICNGRRVSGRNLRLLNCSAVQISYMDLRANLKYLCGTSQYGCSLSSAIVCFPSLSVSEQNGPH